MARQGNYVTLPGGGVNFTKDISDSLRELSQDYQKQASEKDERARLAGLKAENKRRFELGLSREDARTEVEDSRYAAEQAIAASKYEDLLARQKNLDKIAAAERAAEASRYEDSLARKKKLDSIAAAERERVAAERAALRAADAFTYDGGLQNHKYNIDDQLPEMRNLLQGSKGHIKGTKSGAYNVLTADGNYDPSKGTYETVMADYKKLMKNSDLTKDVVNENVAAFGRDILGLMHERTSGGYTPEEWQTRAAKIVSDRFDPLINNINEGIEAGKGLPRRRALSSVARSLPKSVRDNLLISDLDAVLGNRLDFRTTADIAAAEQARVASLNEVEKTIYDRNLDKLKLIKDAGMGSGGGGSTTAKGLITAMKTLGIPGLSEEAIGSKDMDDVRKGVKYLIDEGYDPEAIAATFMGGVELKWLTLDNDFPEVGTEAFAKLTKRVKDLDGNYSGGGGASLSRALNRSKDMFGYKPEIARSVLDVLKEDSFRIRGNDNYSLGVPARYAQAAAKDYTTTAPPEEEEKQKDTDTASEALPDARKELLNSVSDGTITPGDILSPKTLKLFNPPSPDSINTRGRRTSPLTEQNRVSKEILDTIDLINRKDRYINSRTLLMSSDSLESSNSLVPSYNMNRVARQNRLAKNERDEAVAQLKALEAKLQNLYK